MNLLLQYRDLENEIKQIDQILYGRLSQADEPIRSAAIQMLQAGGKRSRPLLCLISSSFGERDRTKAYNMASAIELIHMSSLIHDDMIDHAQLRRGKKTIHLQYNTLIATMVGDYLVAEALEIMALIEDKKAHQLFSNTLKQLAIGELIQYQNRYQLERSLKTYFKKNRNKTAKFIALSCILGAIATQADKKLQKHLYLIGYYLGMSYQIVDDILDFSSNSDKMGKLIGQDLREGYLTLPTLLAMNDDQIYIKVHNLFKQSNQGNVLDFEDLIADIKNSNAISKAYQYSQWYLEKARQKINQLPDQAEKYIFLQLIGYLSKRKY